MRIPSIQKAIEDAIDNKLYETHTAFPAIVTRVDREAGKCDVKPTIKRKYADGTLIELPIINSVPIADYRAGRAFISLPLKAGDYVLILISERSLDVWLNKGGVVDPQDGRRHHLTDAIAYPGVYPFNMPAEGVETDDIVIKNDKSKVQIQPSGKYLLSGESEELMDLLVQLAEKVQEIADELEATTVNTIFGPIQLNSFVTFGLLGNQVAQIKDKIDEMKGD
jgi:hypothetical protein